MPEREQRTLTFDFDSLEVEERADDQAPLIVGHAAVFNQLSLDLGGYRERIRRGAFTKTILEADVRAPFNHDANIVLGRSKSKTLEMGEDETGLLVKITPPRTQLINDMVLEPIRRRDISQMSFMFRAQRQERLNDFVTQERIRELIEVRLYDVSVVTFPAYEGADVAVRSTLAAVGIDYQALSQAIERSKSGRINDNDRLLVRSAIAALESVLTVAPLQEEHPTENEASKAQVRQNWLKRQLELLALE